MNDTPKELTLRDYFAAHAIQGLLANNWSFKEVKNFENVNIEEFADFATFAYEMADAMLKDREFFDIFGRNT